MSWFSILNISGLWNGGSPAPVDQSNQLPVKDDYNGVEYLADQQSSGSVLTFPFTASVQKIWVELQATSQTDTSTARAQTDGNAPTASRGILLHAGQVQPISCPSTTVLKVLAPTGYTVVVYGYRR